tara:strand:- start:61 stop:186 length:126 start_codon:yes stop_codon:yes gene_type:complete
MLGLDAALTVWCIHPAIFTTAVVALIDAQLYNGLQYLFDLV